MILHFIIRCAAALAIPGLTKNKMRDLVIPHSVSRAWRLGEAVLRARCDHADPIFTILKHCNGSLIFMGKVKQNEQTNKEAITNKHTSNKTKQNKTKQNKTKQKNETKRNKTKQNKTKQNKTKHNKT